MGLKLSDSKKARGSKEAKAMPKSKRGGKIEKTPKATTKAKARRPSTKGAIEPDDEVVIPKATPRKDDSVTVAPVGPFEGGLVHSSLRNGVNAHRYRSEESDLFGEVLSKVCLVDGVFFGAIFVKSSFAKRTGGSALL